MALGLRRLRWFARPAWPLLGAAKLFLEERLDPKAGPAPPLRLCGSLPDDTIGGAWVGGAEMKELVVDLVATKGPELWEFDIFGQRNRLIF